MAVYRITRFAAADMDKLADFGEQMRDALGALNAISIDVVSYGNGKGVVLAKYENAAAMDAAAEGATAAFGEMIAAGIVDADSIHPHAGEVIFSV